MNYVTNLQSFCCKTTLNWSLLWNILCGNKQCAEDNLGRNSSGMVEIQRRGIRHLNTANFSAAWQNGIRSLWILGPIRWRHVCYFTMYHPTLDYRNTKTLRNCMKFHIPSPPLSFPFSARIRKCYCVVGFVSTGTIPSCLSSFVSICNSHEVCFPFVTRTL
jgi:hypothetical protein